MNRKEWALLRTFVNETMECRLSVIEKDTVPSDAEYFGIGAITKMHEYAIGKPNQIAALRKTFVEYEL